MRDEREREREERERERERRWFMEHLLHFSVLRGRERKGGGREQDLSHVEIVGIFLSDVLEGREEIDVVHDSHMITVLGQSFQNIQTQSLDLNGDTQTHT